MFAQVGMQPSLADVTVVRNEILHSGLSDRPAEELMELQENLLALVREYLHRLIGYIGAYYTGHSGGVEGTIP